MSRDFIYTGYAVYDDNEIQAVVDTLKEKRLGLSKKGKEFERRFAEYITAKSCVLTNSGSSSSLLALDAMKHFKGLKGGEIITPACGFPTTINPIFQLGFTPVFTDVDKTYNISPEYIREAITDKTTGIIFAHTLGNPAKIEEIMDIASENNLFVIEDCCDAYGSRYKEKMCGSFADLSTYSFYPAHNITLAGEGGAVTTSNPQLEKILRSLRDWGRDCFCEAWQDNRCGKRFEHKLTDGQPYDHKYIFARQGYNLKPTEIQAAFGLIQLSRLEEFNKRRRENFTYFQESFSDLRDHFEQIEVNEGADPVLFGYPLMIKNTKIERISLLGFLNDNKIATRLLFGGDLTRHPAYSDAEYSVSGNLTMTDNITKNLFWVGVHPNVHKEDIDYIHSKLKEYIQSK
jgi:CDP-6-deoxy-D-xylo-4-hexulose-3-dehydrase